MKYLSIILFLCLLNQGKIIYCQPSSIHPGPHHDLKSNETIKAQTEIYSLKLLVDQGPDDTVKVLRLLELSGQYIYLDSIDRAIGTTGKAKKLAERIRFHLGTASASMQTGAIYEHQKDYRKAIACYREGLENIEAHPAAALQYDNFYSPLFNLLFYFGDYPEAMKVATHGLTLAEKIQDKTGEARIYNIMGYIYCQQDDLAESKKYYDRYLSLAQALNDRLMIAHALSETSEVFVKEKDYAQALSFLERSAGLYLQLSKMKKRSIGFDTASWVESPLARTKYSIGRVYKLKGEYPLALKYSLEAVAYADSNRVTWYDKASYMINAGDVYLQLGDPLKAILFLQQGLSIAREIQHRENIRDACESLAKAYASIKKYDSAYIYYSQYTGLKDSIANNETRMKIAAIQGQYDVAKKDEEISRQQQIRNILIISFFFLLLLLGVLYNRYQLKQKNRYQQQQNRQQNTLFNAIASAQDQERKRIAQDIHDSVGAILSAAKLRFSSLNSSLSSLSDDEKEKFKLSLRLLDEASTELRNISHNIMPATLSKLGLISALKNLSDSISSHSGLQIHFSAHDFAERLEEQVEMSIYRIVLELINNVVKHAQATKLTVQLIRYPDYLNISVEDNGRGFDYQKESISKKGIGLGNIFSRVDYLKGKINMDTQPGRGTAVIMDIPYLVV